MSVSSSTSTISYTGNGSTSTAYTVPFAFYDATDLKVYSVNASGVSTLLTLTTNYTVSGGGGSTGSITTTAAIPSTSTVLINRTVPYTQLTSFTTGDRLPANSIEAALDKLTMEAQQLSRNTLPDTAATTGSAPYVLGVSATGGNPSWVPQSSSGIADGSITTSKLADAAITSAKIANGAILPEDLSTGGPSWDASGNVTASGNLITNGNAGIGTSSPATKLDVAGGINVRNDSSNGFILFAPKYGTDVFGANWDRFELRIDPTSQVTYLGNSSGGSGQSRALALTTGAAERIRIDTSGNVGIGNTNPTTKLDVTGLIQSKPAAGTYPQFNLNSLDSGKWKSFIQFQNNGTPKFELGVDGPNNGTNNFYIYDNVSGAQRFRINSDGSIRLNGNQIADCPNTAKAWVNFNGNAIGSDYTSGNTITYTVSGSVTTVVISRSSHTISVGWWVTVSGVTGATGINGTYKVTSVNATQIVYQIPSVVTGGVGLL